MFNRIHEVPAYRVECSEVDAHRYNLIHRAIKRLGAPLRLELPGLKSLDILLDTDCWACVDRSALDLPILAWLLFEDHARSDLQAPVACQLRHYHARTDVLLPRFWETLEALLNEKLQPNETQISGRVTSLEDRERD